MRRQDCNNLHCLFTSQPRGQGTGQDRVHDERGTTNYTLCTAPPPLPTTIVPHYDFFNAWLWSLLCRSASLMLQVFCLLLVRVFVNLWLYCSLIVHRSSLTASTTAQQRERKHYVLTSIPANSPPPSGLRHWAALSAGVFIVYTQYFLRTLHIVTWNAQDSQEEWSDFVINLRLHSQIFVSKKRYVSSVSCTQKHNLRKTTLHSWSHIM